MFILIPAAPPGILPCAYDLSILGQCSAPQRLSFETSHSHAQKDAVLSKEQAQLLKLIGVQMAVFKVALAGRWSEDEGWVEMAGLKPPPANGEGEADGEAEEMDDD